MEGLGKYITRLRKKTSSMGTAERPKDSPHGNCLVCGRFMEYIRMNGRCMTHECNAFLVQLCKDRNLGFTTDVPPDTLLTIIRPEEILEERRKWFHTAEMELELEADQDTCSCKRALKLPGKTVCANCYREGKVAEMRTRRDEQKAAHDRKKARKEKKIANRIKGLEGLTLK
jgi:hypothetical protein